MSCLVGCCVVRCIQVRLCKRMVSHAAGLQPTGLPPRCLICVHMQIFLWLQETEAAVDATVEKVLAAVQPLEDAWQAELTRLQVRARGCWSGMPVLLLLHGSAGST